MYHLFPFGNKQTLQEINQLVLHADGDILLHQELLDPSAIAEELQQILYSFERYGAVSPRMQDGSWLSLPYDKQEADIPADKEALLVDAAKAYLPKTVIVPNARASCVMIRRDIVDNFGFLDTSFETMEGALADFCLRINRYGYSMIAANHLFLSGAKVLSESVKDRQRILSEYPYWQETIDQYIQYDVHACDYFLTVLAKGYYEKTRVLLNYINMPPFHNGTSQVQLDVLQFLHDHCLDTCELFVCANQAAVDFHQLRQYQVTLIDPCNISGVYHISYSGSQPFYLDRQLVLNHHCLKNVYSLLDVIMCRCDYLQTYDMWRDDVARQMIGYSDGLVFISRFGLDDYHAYFSSDPELTSCLSKVVYLASAVESKPEKSIMKLPFAHYALIPGSRYAHKGLQRAVDAVAGSHDNYIVLGLEQEGFLADNVFNYRGGSLTDEELQQLYRCSDCVVFPSLYEGFGLPVLNAAMHGKRLVLLDNNINRELLTAFPQLNPYLMFVTEFKQIPEQVRYAGTLSALEPVEISYTREDSASEVYKFLTMVLDIPVDRQTLQEKWHLANLFTARYQASKQVEGVIHPNDNPSLTEVIKARYGQKHPRLFALAYGTYKFLHRKSR